MIPMNYYYSIPGEGDGTAVHGPVTLEQLRDWYHSGQAHESTLVATDAPDASWQHISDVVAIRPPATQVSPTPAARPQKKSGGAGNAIANLIWFIPGVLMWFSYTAAGILSCLTIIGIGQGIQSFKLAGYALWPFGKEIVTTPAAGGCLATVGNLIWLIVGGWWLAILHLLNGVLLAILIITIPWAKKQFSMASLALSPYGKKVVAA